MFLSSLIWFEDWGYFYVQYAFNSSDKASVALLKVRHWVYNCRCWSIAENLHTAKSAAALAWRAAGPLCWLLMDVITHFSNSETRNLVWILNPKFPYKSQRGSWVGQRSRATILHWAWQGWTFCDGCPYQVNWFNMWSGYFLLKKIVLSFTSPKLFSCLLHGKHVPYIPPCCWAGRMMYGVRSRCTAGLGWAGLGWAGWAGSDTALTRFCSPAPASVRYKVIKDKGASH